MSLSEGAIAKITAGGATSEEFKPTLQVVELKQIQTKQTQPNDRFRLVLSDGTHLQQAMLGTQINHLVKDNNLRPGSIVQLQEYSCSTVQCRTIIIILELTVVVEECAVIGNPVPAQKSLAPPVSSACKPVNHPTNPHSFGSCPPAGGMADNPNRMNQIPSSSRPNNYDSGRLSAVNAPPSHLKSDPGSVLYGSASVNRSYNDQSPGFRTPKQDIPQTTSSYSYPHRPAYQQPPPMYANRGPVAKNEAPPAIVPIAALNPYQGRWTIKARVTTKGELRHYNNARGDGKVFSFDLLDSNGGEIRVTCFNSVADQFYHQIEAGKVYLISGGSLKPAQKNFNHLHNDHEIFLESSSLVKPCFEDDILIPRQQFHFRPISEVEGMDNNSVVDVIGVVTSITPVASIMRKNGTETQKRSLQLKDLSGRSVELTLWGNFCNAEGQRLQSMCDSGEFPVLAVKSARVSDFNGKAVGTISTSQLFIEPDFPEACRVKEWFEKEGKNIPSVSISRELSSAGRSDVQKTISQIKDEKLGTSEKPDWITVNATVIFIKADNFCYTACPIMAGDRPCSKKVTNNGDGKWRCEKCDQSMDECDYRYILQLQIQDHTGLTWVTAFQESGQEIMGISARDLHFMKYENQDDDGFSKILRQVLFSRFVFKLKVKEETFSDEQRVKSTVVRAEKVNFSSQSRCFIDMMEKFKSGNSTPFMTNAEPNCPNTGANTGIDNVGNRLGGGMLGSNQVVNGNFASREFGSQMNQAREYGNQYASGYPAPNLSCMSCGATGHSANSCPNTMNAPRQSAGGFNITNRPSSFGGSGGAGGECYKCHQVGHWARDCPMLNNVPPAYGNAAISSGGFRGISR